MSKAGRGLIILDTFRGVGKAGGGGGVLGR